MSLAPSARKSGACWTADMPWGPGDAHRHTKKATSAHAKAVWAKISTGALHSGKSEGASIRIANAAIKRMKGRK